MADTTASTGASCLERLKSYVKTPKGFILAAEIVSSGNSSLAWKAKTQLLARLLTWHSCLFKRLNRGFAVVIDLFTAGSFSADVLRGSWSVSPLRGRPVREWEACGLGVEGSSPEVKGFHLSLCFLIWHHRARSPGSNPVSPVTVVRLLVFSSEPQPAFYL